MEHLTYATVAFCMFFGFIFWQLTRRRQRTIFRDIGRAVTSEPFKISTNGKPGLYHLENHFIFVDFWRDADTTETAVFKPWYSKEPISAVFQDNSLLEIHAGEVVTTCGLDPRETKEAQAVMDKIHHTIAQFESSNSR